MEYKRQRDNCKHENSITVYTCKPTRLPLLHRLQNQSASNTKVYNIERIVSECKGSVPNQSVIMKSNACIVKISFI